MSKNHEYNHDPSDWVPMPDSQEKSRISVDTWHMLALFAAIALIALWMTKC
jgi:hypothetical protein